MKGSPAGQPIKVRVVWLYPKPGLILGGTGKARLRDEYETDHKLGWDGSFYWTLDGVDTHVPGKWTLQLWQGDRLLAQQFFDLVK